MINLFLFFVLILGFGASFFVIYQLVSFLIWGQGKHAGYVSSVGQAKKDTLKIANHFLNKSKKKMTVVEPGCGSGALLIPMAKSNPKHQFIGYEWDWMPYLITRWKARNMTNVRVCRMNYFKADFHHVDMVVCYLFGPKTLTTFAQKMQSEMKTGGIIISEVFSFPSLSPIQVAKSFLYGISVSIFVYQIRESKKLP